ncbi:unnamed protein product [Ectocarpus sp. 8 AP-2014]
MALVFVLLCSCARSEVCSSMSPPMVVAIDFGTTRSAYAFTVEGEASGKILVRVPDTAAASRSSSVKTETAALLSRGGRGDLIAFGPAALEQFTHEDHDEDDPALFRWFKVDLCKSGHGQTSVQGVLTKSSSGRHTVPLLHVMKASLGYFKNDILRFLSDTRGRSIDATEVTWVITVPAIYDDFAKRFMRQAAHGAGMIDRVDSVRLRLCLEPEAACLAVTTDDNPLTCEDEGKHMMIVDCGGGMVDIVAHKILSVDPLKLFEVAAPDGGVWGSTRVDKAFEEWFKMFLGRWEKEIDDETWLSIMMTWERKKAEFTGRDALQSLRLDLSQLCNNGLTRADMEELRTRYNSSRSTLHTVTGKNFAVVLPAALVSSFFRRTLENIAQCLRNISGMSALRNLHRVYLVGGFSRSPLLKSMAREELQRVTRCVVDVHEPDLAIVKGAVMYPSMSTVFNSRKAKLTYGVGVALEFNGTNSEHVRRRAAGKTLLIEDKVWVSGCFSAHVTVGDDVPSDGVLTCRGYTPFSETFTRHTVNIYATSKKRPRYVDEPGVFRLGEVAFDLDMSKPSEKRGYRVEMTFGGTELKVRVLHRTDDEQIRDAVMNPCLGDRSSDGDMNEFDDTKRSQSTALSSHEEIEEDSGKCGNKDGPIQRLLDEGKPLHEMNTDADKKTDYSRAQCDYDSDSHSDDQSDPSSYGEMDVSDSTKLSNPSALWNHEETEKVPDVYSTANASDYSKDTTEPSVLGVSTDEPTQGDQSSVFVENISSTTEQTFFDEDSGVRLRVGPGCLREGEVVRPISVITDKRLIVESGGSSFLVSTAVDCRPSGAIFQKPLVLEFIVGDDKDLEGSKVTGEERAQHLADLQDTYKVFWSAEEGARWTRLDGGAVVRDKTLGKLFYRVDVDHFSRGYLGKNLNLECPCLTDVVRIGRPYKRQLEFVNATDKRVTFLVLPTGYSQSAITSLNLGVQVQGDGGNLAIERAVESIITEAATGCQAFTVPAKTTPGKPTIGQPCPYHTCYLPKRVDPEARVVMTTINNGKLFKWFTQIFPQRTRVVVLPRMFSDPEGYLESGQLVEAPVSVANPERMANRNTPVATLSSRSGAGGASAAQPMPEEEKPDGKARWCTTS